MLPRPSGRRWRSHDARGDGSSGACRSSSPSCTGPTERASAWVSSASRARGRTRRRRYRGDACPDPARALPRALCCSLRVHRDAGGSRMIVLGLNAYHGDASAAILVDGQLVAAAEEKRFVRVKHWAGFPRRAVEYCLAAANARVEDIDHIAIGRNPRANLLDKVIYTLVRRPSTKLVAHRLRNTLKVRDPKSELAKSLRVDPGRIRATAHNVEHHLAHISSAFFASPYDESAIVSVDGCGDFVSTMWGTGRGGRLQIANRVAFPHSLGFFYSGITQYLGFPKFGDEYKVMGLSAYGEPDVADKIRQLVLVKG